MNKLTKHSFTILQKLQNTLKLSLKVKIRVNNFNLKELIAFHEIQIPHHREKQYPILLLFWLKAKGQFKHG